MSNIGFENINISSAIHSREETLKINHLVLQVIRSKIMGNSNLDFRCKKKYYDHEAGMHKEGRVLHDK